MEKVLILKTVNAQGIAAHGNFKWPESGPVECPDWSPEPKCGNGLHGALWGEGDGSLFNWSEDAIWVVFEALASDVVDLGGKVKVPRGEVVYYGNRKDATDMIYKARNGAVIGGTATAGDSGTATAGYSGTATAGYSGTATAGDSGTATAGDSGTATAGYSGTATAGDSGTATAGRSGTATAGKSGTATAGDRGTATAGDCGTATAGDSGTATAGRSGTATAGRSGTATAGHYGTATAGDSGTATAGDCGTATAGDSGTIILKYWDKTRYRVKTGYIGEGGLLPNVAYKLDEKNEFVAVQG